MEGRIESLATGEGGKEGGKQEEERYLPPWCGCSDVPLLDSEQGHRLHAAGVHG